MNCSRCGRTVTAPVFAGGMAFGRVCFGKVIGVKKRQARRRICDTRNWTPADPRQVDWINERT